MIRTYVEFVLSRLVGTAVDTGVLWLFSSCIFTSYVGQCIISPMISFECAVFTNFLFSYYWVWGKRRDEVNQGAKKSFWTHFLKFNVSSLSAFGVKMAFLLLFQTLLGWNVVWCNLLALCISGLVNFFLSEFVVFKKKKSDGSTIN